MIVTRLDLIPAGWVCEGCGHPFEVGDSAYGVLTAVHANGLIEEGEYRCVTCWREDGYSLPR